MFKVIIALVLLICALLGLIVFLYTNYLEAVSDKEIYRTKWSNSVQEFSKYLAERIIIENIKSRNPFIFGMGELSNDSDPEQKHVIDLSSMDINSLRVLRNAMHPDRHQGKHHELWVKINARYEELKDK